MRAVVSSLLVLALVIAARPAGAQEGPPIGLGPPGPPPAEQPPPAKAPRPGTPAPTPTAQPAPTPPGVSFPGPPGPVIPKRMVNVQVELTITDQLGTGAPEKKTVSMIAADSTWGRIRAGANARTERTGGVSTVINVDARPFLLPNQSDMIQLELTIEYKPLRTVTSGDPTQMDPTNLNQSMTVILTSGKPLQVSQAADPITDRKILAEVKATILK